MTNEHKNACNTIRNLIMILTPADRSDLLNELGHVHVKEELHIGDAVIKFGHLIQKKYGKSIKFNVVENGNKDNKAIIVVTLITPYGEFIGKGQNKTVAKHIALKKANSNFKP